MMLMAASCPSNRLAAVTRRTGCFGTCSAASVMPRGYGETAGAPKPGRRYVPAHADRARTRRTGPGCSSGCAPSAASTPQAVDRDELAGPHRGDHRRVAGDPRAARRARRPDDSTWSPLEYACHVRDVHRVYAGRVGRMLAEDDPYYENWDQDATAIEDRYAEQDPATVAGELADAGDELGALFAGVDGRRLGAHRPAQRRRRRSRSTRSAATTSTTSSTTSGTSPEPCPRGLSRPSGEAAVAGWADAEPVVAVALERELGPAHGRRAAGRCVAELVDEPGALGRRRGAAAATVHGSGAEVVHRERAWRRRGGRRWASTARSGWSRISSSPHPSSGASR